MLDEAEYASDTDESDDDYKPDADGSDVSEVESDGEPENDVENQSRAKKRPANVEVTSLATKRNKLTEEKIKTTEKDELDDDEDDENEDALWASFLSNTGQTSAKTAATKPSEPSKKVASTSNGSSTQTAKEKPKESPRTEQKKVVTEIFEFAGEKVEVKKVVTVTDEKPATEKASNSKNVATKAGPALSFGRSRGGGGGSGLSSVLGQIGKKNKLSLLEKSKLDWSGFKQKEGIDEELQTHNKGRDGYLERQDFLQRTDLRTFEIEKNMRAATRKKL